ncbi:MAG TPA: hypothetical protein VLA89_10325 [Gemmatimonadales bacterium]|nr:hypothetical protein [Gemmatimonadales bacterium]
MVTQRVGLVRYPGAVHAWVLSLPGCVAGAPSAGEITKDVAILLGPDQPWLTTEDFLAALDRRLQAKMA